MSNSEIDICCKCGDIDPTGIEYICCEYCFDLYCYKCQYVNNIDFFEVFSGMQDFCVKCGIQLYIKGNYQLNEHQKKLLHKIALGTDDELKKIITDFLLKCK